MMLTRNEPLWGTSRERDDRSIDVFRKDVSKMQHELNKLATGIGPLAKLAQLASRCISFEPGARCTISEGEDPASERICLRTELQNLKGR